MREAKKTISSTQNAKILPKNWADFAPLLDIKSGSKLIKFDPYPYQIILNKLIDRYPNVICIKTRQVGNTDFLLSKLLHNAILNQAYSAAVFSLKDEDASDCSQRSRTMLKSLDLLTTNNNVHELTLKSGGSIYFRNSSPQGSRGRALSCLYFDEASHNRNIEDIVSASTPSLTMTDASSKIFVSTPGSTDSYFFNEVLSADNGDLDIIDTCQRVASGELFKDIPGFYYFTPNEDTVKVIIHWRAIPKFAELDEKLKNEGGYLQWRKLKNSLSETVLQRDHNLTFLSGEEAVFSSELVENALRGNLETTRQKGYNYIAGLDTNTVGENYLVFTVLKENLVTRLLSMVGMYRAKKRSQEFHVYEIAKLIRNYRIDKVGIERNAGGAFYLERLVQEFPEVDITGYDTTGVSKPLMVGRLLSALERDLLEMPNDNTIRKEFLNFSRIGNQFEAIAGNDDIVMSLAIALQRSDLATIPEQHEGFEFDDDITEMLRGA